MKIKKFDELNETWLDKDSQKSIDNISRENRGGYVNNVFLDESDDIEEIKLNMKKLFYNFKKAWYELEGIWHFDSTDIDGWTDYVEGKSLENISKKYPFDHSYDEYDIHAWINDAFAHIEKFKKNKE